MPSLCHQAVVRVREVQFRGSPPQGSGSAAERKRARGAVRRTSSGRVAADPIGPFLSPISLSSNSTVRAPARDQEADILACARHVRLGGCERRQTSLSELFRQPHTSCAISAPETSTLPVRAHRADLFFESKASGVARSGSSACRKPDAGAVPEASEGRSCLGTWYACADASACRATPARGRPAISRWRPPSAPYLETLCHDNHEEFHEELTTRRRRSRSISSVNVRRDSQESNPCRTSEYLL